MILAIASGGCGSADPAPGPTTVTTCELRDGGTKYDGTQVAVHGVIRTDLMHFQDLESAGCAHRRVKMYFAADSRFNPCGDSDFAKGLQCPLDALDWRIEATFIGTYHSKDQALEVRELKAFKRTKAVSSS